MSRRVSWAAHLAARPVGRLHADGPLPPAHGAAVAAADADARPGARSRRDMTDGSAREVSSSRAYLGVISSHLGRCPAWSPPSGRARRGRVRSRRARPCGRTRLCAPREFAENPEGIRRATLSAAPHPPDILAGLRSRECPPSSRGLWCTRCALTASRARNGALPSRPASPSRCGNPRPWDPRSRRISRCGCPMVRGSNHRDLGEYLGAGVSKRGSLPVRRQERRLRLRAADRIGARLRQHKQRQVRQVRHRWMGASNSARD